MPTIAVLWKLLVLALAAIVAACGGGGDIAALQAPGVLSQPADQAVTEGAAASFTVSASGSAPLRYQWAVSTDGQVFTPIDGATAATYATTPALAANGSHYRVVVSNDAGSITSSAGSLRVTRAIVEASISVQPADQSVTAPAAANFHVTAAGTDLTYQWQVSVDGGVSYSATADAGSSPTLTLATTTLNESGQRYRVVVGNTLSSVTSVAALLTVQPTPIAPMFTSSPAAQVVVVGQATSFAITATGTPMPSIRWQLGGIDLIEGPQGSGPCTGATANGTQAATLTLTALPLSCSGAAFGAVASNGVSPDAASAVATLTVNPAPAAPQIATQPANAAVLAPATAPFTATAAGVPTPTVQWQQSSDAGATWANVNGATSPSFTTPATQLSDSGKLFRAVFSNASGTSTTLAATLTVTTPEPIVSLWLGDIGGRGNFDGLASAARFSSPVGITHDAAGNLFVADSGNNLIRRLTPAGVVSTVAGSGAFDHADGTGRNAAFASPQGIAIDASGVLYVADTGNSVIRKITPDGTVSTFAGGIGAFIRPTGLVVDAGGVVYVADAGLRQILVVTPSGDVSTLAAAVVDSGGNTVPASFNQPYGIARDTAGVLYVADAADDRVLKILPSGVTTVLAGTQATRGNLDGAATAALFYGPKGVSVDAAGLLRIADTGNQTIRTIDVTGAVSTLAGLTENAGAVDGASAAARFDPISGFAVDGGGNIFIADGHNYTIRKVTRDGTVSTFAGSPGVNGIGDGTDDGIGTAARFGSGTPDYIAIDGVGNLYVNDVSTVRRVTPGAAVSEFAGSLSAFGTADGTGSSAQFLGLSGFATDAAGNVYVADAAAIRKITAAGVVTTLAGIGDQSGTVDGTGGAARFLAVSGIVVDPSGDVYAVDANTIRKVTSAGLVTTLAGSAAATGPSADGVGSAAIFSSLTGGIASDGIGNLYVSDNCSIRKVTTAGVVTTVLGVAGECGIRLGVDGRIDAPFALAVLSAKRLLIGSHDALLIADLP